MKKLIKASRRIVSNSDVYTLRMNGANGNLSEPMEFDNVKDAVSYASSCDIYNFYMIEDASGKVIKRGRCNTKKRTRDQMNQELWSRSSTEVHSSRSIKASLGSQTLSHQNDYDDKYSAPAKRMAMVFPYFLQDIEDSVKEESQDFGVNGTQFYDSNYYIEFEIIPTCYGTETYDYITIRFDGQDYPQFTAAYDNGYVYASGESFSSILTETANAVKEILIDWYDDHSDMTD